MNLTTLQGKTVEYRTFFGVDVGIIYHALPDGTPAQWIVFPDGKIAQVNTRAYECIDDAQAATVAVWRKRRIAAGIDKPEGEGEPQREFFQAVHEEADSESVTAECGAKGEYGATCRRQAGHYLGTSRYADFHLGKATDSGPDAKYVDDGEDFIIIWPQTHIPDVIH